jgi:hypothetical protein
VDEESVDLVVKNVTEARQYVNEEEVQLEYEKILKSYEED